MEARRWPWVGAVVRGGAIAIALAPGVVRAAEPAVLYVPTDPVELLPLFDSPCGGQVSSALGCGVVDEPSEIPPYPGAMALAEAMRVALDPYDVHVTHTRPPEYLPYVMLMPSDEPAPESMSLTCTRGGINCAARQRNDIVTTVGSTMSCMDPEITHAALYAFGRASGLEGVDDPEDYMHYVPDYASPPVGFLDVCSDRVQQIGFDDRGMPLELPLECTSLDHADCPDGTNGWPQQNGHQDLLLYYGGRTEDFSPPVLSGVIPEDGAELPELTELVLDVDITDADPVVGVRWVIASEQLKGVGIESGRLSKCTNDVCDINWSDATPLKATDSDWEFVLSGLPAGEYTITLEAADFHGNVAETITNVVQIGGSGMDDSSGSTTGPVDPPDPDGPVFTTGEGEGEGEGEAEAEGEGEAGGGRPPGTSGEGDSSESGSGLVLERPGCACRSSSTDPGGMGWLWLGSLGLGVVRRRRQRGETTRFSAPA